MRGGRVHDITILALGRGKEHVPVRIIAEIGCLSSDLPQYDRLDKDSISRNVYSKALGANLLALFKSHCESHHVLCCVYGLRWHAQCTAFARFLLTTDLRPS
jgi:hypothetical protein